MITVVDMENKFEIRMALPMIFILVLGVATALIVMQSCTHNTAPVQSPAATSTSSPGAVKYQCVAGPDEQCASDSWYADYVRMKALQQKYTAPQDQLDLITGMAARLGQSVPPGYYWDDAKSRFVKQKLPTSAPIPVPSPTPSKPTSPPARRK